MQLELLLKWLRSYVKKFEKKTANAIQLFFAPWSIHFPISSTSFFGSGIILDVSGGIRKWGWSVPLLRYNQLSERFPAITIGFLNLVAFELIKFS